MRNYAEVHMLNNIEHTRSMAILAASKPKQVTAEEDKCAIQSYRDSIENLRKIRKPIFDRSTLPKTLGQMALRQQVIETTRFSSFGAMIAAEMKQAGL